MQVEVGRAVNVDLGDLCLGQGAERARQHRCGGGADHERTKKMATSGSSTPREARRGGEAWAEGRGLGYGESWPGRSEATASPGATLKQTPPAPNFHCTRTSRGRQTGPAQSQATSGCGKGPRCAPVIFPAGDAASILRTKSRGCAANRRRRSPPAGRRTWRRAR